MVLVLKRNDTLHSFCFFMLFLHRPLSSEETIKKQRDGKPIQTGAKENGEIRLFSQIPPYYSSLVCMGILWIYSHSIVASHHTTLIYNNIFINVLQRRYKWSQFLPFLSSLKRSEYQKIECYIVSRSVAAPLPGSQKTRRQPVRCVPSALRC